MSKLNLLIVIAAAIFAASATFADDKPCCAMGASNDMKASCEATFAKLDLTAEQKTKMEKLAADCDKTGCTKESMSRMEKSARTILTKKQLAAWKAACAKPADKTQS